MVVSPRGVGVATVAVAVAGIASPAAATVPPTAAPVTPAAHCVLRVVDVAADGEMRTAPPRCFATFAEAMDAAKLPYDDPSQLPDPDVTARPEGARGDLGAADAAPLADRAIGVHFDGVNRTGASITVTGADCSGGYINLSAAWVNRISSTWNQCPNVYFWDGFDKTGAYLQTDLTTNNLGAFSDRANSIGYA